MNATDNSFEELESQDEIDENADKLRRFGITRGQLYFSTGFLFFILLLTLLDFTGVVSFQEAFNLEDRVQPSIEKERKVAERKEGERAEVKMIKGAKKATESHRAAKAPVGKQQVTPQQAGPESDQPIVQGIRLERVRVGLSESHYPPAPKDERRALSSLSNSGEHTLTSARVVMEFFDHKEQLIEQRTVNPLVIAGGVLGDVEKPLAPGEHRPFAATVSNLSSTWSGKVRARIEGMQFKGWDTAQLVP
ncbi:hypothetical protein [Magnetococcus marinus]|nr:hypothetical protein [Magnetococcus marinus]